MGNTGRFIMFFLITNIRNKKTKGPTLMGFFTATGKLKKFPPPFFFTTRDVRCLHHGWHGTHRYDIQVVATHANACVATTWNFQFSRGYEKFHLVRFFGFLVINVCNHEEHYETPCIRPKVINSAIQFLWNLKCHLLVQKSLSLSISWWI